MKRLHVAGLFTLIAIQAFGGPVEPKELTNQAGIFLQVYFGQTGSYRAGTLTQLAGTDSYLYYMNLKPQGWLLLSAEDRTSPVIGFSFTGQFDEEFAQVPNLNQWIDLYIREIRSIHANPALKKHPEREPGYLALKSSHGITIDPLIPVLWDQDAGWNKFCPEDSEGPGGHAYGGCVGVSMAQAMSVFKYPVKGTGTCSYNHADYGGIIVRFDKEAPYLWDSMEVDAPNDENARLLYHTAVSVSMDFGPDGSGSYTSRVPDALSKYFRYSKSINRVARGSNDSIWNRMLIDELLAGRPVIYSGDNDDGEPGHAFNLDGVINDRFFHFNWGWNGKYNGYFTLDNLNPGTYKLNKNQEAVISIRPPVYAPTDLELTRLIVREDMPAGTFVARVKVTDEATDNTYTFDIKGDTTGGGSFSDPDFYLSNDSLKTLRPFDYAEQQLAIVTIAVADQFGNTYQERFEIAIQDNSVPSAILANDRENFSIYPNPSSGEFVIETEGPDTHWAIITTLSGTTIRQAAIDPGTPMHFNYPVPGIYLVHLHNSQGGASTRKLVIH